MISSDQTIGMLGSGMLGDAMLTAMLKYGAIAPEKLWIANRTGQWAGSDANPGATLTTDPAALCTACDVIILCVPPAAMADMSLPATGKLVISVIAGAEISRLADLTGAQRLVRGMCSPAARDGLAYSPWVASPGVTAADREIVTSLFAACGQTDELEREEWIDHFTALTGPVPGFVAFYAQCMADYATAAGVPENIADRAVRQLFLSAGTLMSRERMTPAELVQQMVDYDGTTAAGLKAMRASAIGADIGRGLDAAVDRTRSIARNPDSA